MLELNESNFDVEVNDGLVVVDFYAPWCGPCKALKPVLEELTGAKVVTVNTDANHDLALNMNIAALPTVVFLKDGREVERFVGLKDKKYIQDRINSMK